MQYEDAAALFEAEDYDGAVKAFIDIFQSGELQEEIIQDIYNCFILPNEEEFRKNYESSIDNSMFPVSFEELELDFIPVTEEKYYLYDKKQRQFLGSLDINQFSDVPSEPSFESLCISDQWDLREILRLMHLKCWHRIYIVLGDCQRRLLSFYKIQEIRDILKSVILFPTFNAMEQYFKEKTDYLPRAYRVQDENYYQNMISRIHQNRLMDNTVQEHSIFLSICMPTYNRGSIALQTVKNLLKLKYDYEIEIVVSNNGSVEDIDGYEELKKLQDSRLKYFEFEESQGYASNVRNILGLAEGKWAILTSDEDMMILENLPVLLNCLINNSNAGIVYTTGYGSNFLREEGKEAKALFDIEALLKAMNKNYMTGLTFNMLMVQEKNVLVRFDALRGNVFLEHYAHIVLAVMTCAGDMGVESNVCLWDSYFIEAQQRECNKVSEKIGILEYAKPKSRIEQLNASVEFIYRELAILSDSECISLYMDRILKAYYLLGLTYELYFDELKAEYSWLDICMLVYKDSIGLFETTLNYLMINNEEQIISILTEYFMKNYTSHPAENQLTLDEKVRERIESLLIEYYCLKGRRLEEVDLVILEAQLTALLNSQ